MKREFILNLIKFIIMIACFVVAGNLVYNNFIKDQKFVYDQPDEVNLEELYKKFNIDIFEDGFFKNLVGYDKVSTSTIEGIGRENPFLKF